MAESVENLLQHLSLLCSADHIVYDTEAAEQLISKLANNLDEANQSLELLHQLGEGLFDLLQGGNTSDGRRSASPRRVKSATFKAVTRRFLARIDELVQHKRLCENVVEEKKNKLEQFLQLRSCEEDARKVSDCVGGRLTFCVEMKVIEW